MVDFIEHQVKILTDPLFGDIKDTQVPISQQSQSHICALQWSGAKCSYSGCSQHCWRFSVKSPPNWHRTMSTVKPRDG